ncbi:MAG: beta-ketoacyl-[acyl-carrier-protein] synthase II [Ignavibacteria bacterium RIFOXYB2_FULL_35_12]|nr:MAG: beta-ketoacyl-[acyl-carrier-protein] synthase II [Ignavibacteria bacterium GWA2_36_19]OGU53800.1 MAG: beta-ketoacyl-[acyl-carrier-protein] synthase II [Ignavibacteria bacterium GWC2_35_8]OGU62797.1 MAG: beta-ketoacyl-[acyl-carrier-protein] synthase II [Ignavibacteria bacterium GWF2_35_20]OGU87301.1 MAG: beta-ketoacyl-[acyl-carrier-protein] synthase II [Ignavibacteria bacterium RIFOXYA12_FULL_35_25]OGU91119.1 MAG: beta-ketoacyl-[acyl-carrier-protein] synthase II [Ignavibacteria bacterium
MTSNKNRRVVVTGMGVLTPIGLTVQEFWDAMMNSKSGAANIISFDTSRVDTKFACELKGFDPLLYIDKKTVKRLDPYAQYALSASSQAIVDSGIDVANLSESEKAKIGVIFGSGIGGIQTFYQQSIINHTQGPGRVSPFFIPMMIPDLAAGYISIQYGFRGPNYCIVSACATANNNMIDSYFMIKQGLANIIVTGGSEASINEIGVGGFNASRALSVRNDSPETASRPFDLTRDGFVMGEGGGALILEDLEHALNRNAKIYAEIIGVGLSADAHHITAPHPDGAGAVLAMEMAIGNSDIDAVDVDYVNMHGTSTPLGDIGETIAIKKVFGEHAKKMNLSSTKSMTGHLLGAAGAVEAVASILAIKNGIVPPTINFANADPECDLNYTFNKPQKREVNVALSNAFGFGGHNTSILFSKFFHR